MRGKKNILAKWITGTLLVLCTLAIGQITTRTWQNFQSTSEPALANVAVEQTTLEAETGTFLTLTDAMVMSIRHVTRAIRSGNILQLFTGKPQLVEAPNPCPNQHTVSVKQAHESATPVPEYSL